MSVLKPPLPRTVALRDKMNSRGDAALFAGAYDAVSGLMVERAGYDGIWASSLAVATACGHCDDDRYTMSDVLAATTSMSRVVGVPIVADVGSGQGRGEGLATIVSAFEHAGAAGVCVEETAHPRRNSLLEGDRAVSPADEFAERIAAAVSTRISPEFLIFARVESLIAGLGQDETLRRAALYEAAGADAIVVHSRCSTHQEVGQVVRRWRGAMPLVLIPTMYPRLPICDFLQFHQLGMLIYANQSLRASMSAIEAVLAQIRSDGHAGGVEEWITPVSEVLQLQSKFGEPV